MLIINANDFIKKPSYITNPKDITYIQDSKNKLITSVVIPYELYENLKEIIEDELYIMKNAKALSIPAYDEFSENEA